MHGLLLCFFPLVNRVYHNFAWDFFALVKNLLADRWFLYTPIGLSMISVHAHRPIYNCQYILFITLYIAIRPTSRDHVRLLHWRIRRLIKNDQMFTPIKIYANLVGSTWSLHAREMRFFQASSDSIFCLCLRLLHDGRAERKKVRSREGRKGEISKSDHRCLHPLTHANAWVDWKHFCFAN